jgi:hypothetical protein
MKFMKHIRNLPMPFLILLFAGVVSIYSILVTRTSPAAQVHGDSLQMQTVEQERMAVMYFRVLSWLSDVTPQPAEPAQAEPKSATAPKVARTPDSSECPVRIELCSFPSSRNLAARKSHAHNLD